MKEKPPSPQWNKLISSRIKPLNKRVQSIEKKSLRHAHKYVVQKANRFRSVRRHVIGWLILITFLMLAAILQMILYSRNVTSVQSQSGGVYAEGVVDKVNTLNPLYASTQTERALQRLIFSGLTIYDETGRLQNDVAESITVSEKGKRYSVILRPDVRWHDGKTLTAADVVYTVQAMQNPNIGSREYNTWKNITVSAANDREIVFTLPSPYGPFRAALTFSILPKHILERIPIETLAESSFSKNPIGTGPFRSASIKTVDITSGKNAVKLEANPRYWAGQPLLNRFIVYTYSKPKDLLKGLSSHEVSAAIDVPMKQADFLSKNDYTRHDVPINSGMFAFFKTDSPLLSDSMVRQALVSATNRVPIARAYHGQQLEGPIVNKQLIKTNQVSQLPFDALRAGQLFDQAGWRKNANNFREKDGKILELSLVAPNTYDYTQLSNRLAKQWRTQGVRIKQQFIDAQQIQQNILRPRTYDIVLYELEIGGDPDVMAYWHSSQRNAGGLNLANFSSGISDDALLTARLRDDMVSRDAKYASFVKDWTAQAPAVALYQPTVSYVSFSSVQSLTSQTIVPTIPDRFSTASTWTVNKTMTYQTP